MDPRVLLERIDVVICGKDLMNKVKAPKIEDGVGLMNDSMSPRKEVVLKRWNP
jgi:hypothetical protein